MGSTTHLYDRQRRHPSYRTGWPASAHTGPRPRQDGDRWLAEDKLKHFFMSFAATSFAFSGARSFGLARSHSLVVATGSAAAVGVGKEWYDVRTGGLFSRKDLVWDALGIVAGVVLLAATD